MEFGSARRAKENSPAIHRWVLEQAVPKSRRDDRTPVGLGRQGVHDFCRPCGTYPHPCAQPGDESLGYFRSSLRDLRLPSGGSGEAVSLAMASVYSTENSEEPNSLRKASVAQRGRWTLSRNYRDLRQPDRCPSAVIIRSMEAMRNLENERLVGSS